jgi:hypothetical protein
MLGKGVLPRWKLPSVGRTLMSLPFFQAAKRCYAESVRCKRMFQVFQMYQRYVVSISFDVAKVDPDVAYVISVSE